MKRKNITTYLTQTGIIAAIYIALTFLLAPISYGAIQMRVSEALCVLPMFTPAAVPGLFIGCLISNGLSPAISVFDIVLGSLSTFAAAYLAYKIKIKWLVPLPAVLINAFVVPYILILSGVPDIGYWFTVLTVGIGQAIACYGIGLPLMLILEKYKGRIFKKNTN